MDYIRIRQRILTPTEDGETHGIEICVLNLHKHDIYYYIVLMHSFVIVILRQKFVC